MSSTPSAPAAQPDYGPMPDMAAKLQAVIAEKAAAKGGDTPPPARSTTPPAHLADTAEPPKQQQSPVEQQIARLNEKDNENGIWSNDPVKQKAAVAELNRMLAAAASDEERANIVNATTPELRERFGLDEKLDALPAFLKDSWNSDAERDYLATFADQGIAPKAVQEIATWYQKQFTNSLGDASEIDADAAESDFRAMAGRLKLPSDLVNALVKHERQRLGLRS